ncbi:hypothetical protein BGZ60DRAFT_413945 [Tricladium varicosporioides]|nr:hypothetical protein BGZ60DRAFT_413945 [Hymenoscyphus varicosporioides]
MPLFNVSNMPSSSVQLTYTRHRTTSGGIPYDVTESLHLCNTNWCRKGYKIYISLC